MAPTVDALHWWQRGIIYQVYPRSYQDSNGDGIGDLPGVLARLDYLVALGVDALWLSPVYPSPMADFGYDVADYCAIDPVFGTLADFDRLLAAAHARGLKVLMDFVPNHTSDAHPWFVQSRSARDAARRDWYLWRDAAPDGGPPNNWLSRMGGPAWTWDAGTGQYYYHSFLAQQPDLNWRNPAVRAAMREVLHFWLARGVDGFRIDVLWLLIKDARFTDNPPNPAYTPDQGEHQRLLPIHTEDQPEVHEVVRALRAIFDAYPERVMIGEIYLPVDRLVGYYGAALDEAHLPFNFQLIGARWDAALLARGVADYLAALPPSAWPNWVLGNHDNARIASRIGPAQARCAALLLLTLPGTPTIYYGEELGLRDVAIPPARVQDPVERNEPGLGLGRDPERTPMQWDASPQAGFTHGTPWLPLAADWASVNVAALAADPASILTFYRMLIALRRRSPALLGTVLTDLHADGDVLVFERSAPAQRLRVLLNLSARARVLTVEPARVLLSTALDRHEERVARTLALRGDEGVVLLLE